MNHELSRDNGVSLWPARRLVWLLTAALSVLIALLSARYLTLNPNLAAPPFRGRLAAHDPWLLLHIAGGVVALALGAFQFPAAFRNRHLVLHRRLGQIYLLAVLAGSIAGFRIALISGGGTVGHYGFGLLAVFWFVTAAVAYRRATQMRIRSHRNWMVRNFSLTFAAVTLRFWLPLFTAGFGLPFLPSYAAISWLCWIPNFLVAEWLLRVRPVEYLAR